MHQFKKEEGQIGAQRPSLDVAFTCKKEFALKRGVLY
ncbi:hypothetical protein EPIR_1970 [Erwinia piriflorinigrans CFBP 5888]|uniref:Uncharacterized protein n=1 Tax=Erwinia piriflorinigrans CFBP 5888 TaxID=1161919 RepID=V5Z8R2_9GAMM|nr:hypothetical protein EPIR_1970 [Erwinia piriflorinigrans CFBP 5888]